MDRRTYKSLNAIEDPASKSFAVQRHNCNDFETEVLSLIVAAGAQSRQGTVGNESAVVPSKPTRCVMPKRPNQSDDVENQSSDDFDLLCVSSFFE